MPQQNKADDERFMRMALDEAQAAAAEGEVPIGAVVVCGGRMVARAHNRRELDGDPSAHAEFAAMVAASRELGRWRLIGCTVYVTLEPCLMCAGLMVNARIDRCVYGARDPKAGAVGSLFDVSCDERLNHMFAVTEGVLEGECAGLLRSFFTARRKSGTPRVLPGDAAHAELAATGCSGMRAGMQRDWATRADRHAPCVLLAVDSFKGSATSEQVEAWLVEGMRSSVPGVQATCLPVADGGEGTVGAVHAARGGELRTVTVADPFGRPCDASYLLFATPDQPMAAVIEMASAAGIGFSACTHEAALAASTCGVGELMLDAVAQGARTIYVGLGGSATTDGGAGMLRILGAHLQDAAGNPVAPGLNGLRDVASIDISPVVEALRGIDLIALSDVKNPLVGKRGAVRVFGPQKGLASDEPAAGRGATLDACDVWMTTYATRLTAARDMLDVTPLQVGLPGKRAKSLAAVPGAGAAGGLGAALLALGAKLVPGIDAVLDLAGFDDAARQADIVVTGEGSLDAQSAEGKAPVGVAQRAKRANPRARVVAVCGGRADDLDAAYRQGVDIVLPIVRRPMSLEEALRPEQARANLICAGETIARLAR